MARDKPIIERKFNEDLDVEERVKEGGVLARLYLEVQGNDKEAAKKALESTVMEGMVEESTVDVLEVRLYDILKDEEKNYFSGVVEVLLVARDFRWLVNLVMRYGPTAIEVVEPEEFLLGLEDMQALLGDVSSLTQMWGSQVMAMLKDDERAALYSKILAKGE